MAWFVIIHTIHVITLSHCKLNGRFETVKPPVALPRALHEMEVKKKSQ
jgi:hypothetical protein